MDDFGRSRAMPPGLRDTAAVLFHLHGWSEAAVRDFIVHKRPNLAASPEVLETALNHIRGMRRDDVRHDTTADIWWMRRRTDAQKHLQDVKLLYWVQQQNRVVGQAPTTKRLIHIRDVIHCEGELSRSPIAHAHTAAISPEIDSGAGAGAGA